MVSYSCNLCCFVTNLKGNYSQHLKTKKHLSSIEDSLQAMVKSQKEPKKSQKEPVFRNLIMVLNMVILTIFIRTRP